MSPVRPHETDPDTEAENEFFAGLIEPVRIQDRAFDLYTSNPQEPGPAVVFVHGGPVPEDARPTPRSWKVFTGYGALAASHGLIGVTFDHRLYTMEHYPLSVEDVSAVVEQVSECDQIDPGRIVLWFFSGGGGLAADWLRRPPQWLRGIVWSYPILAPPPDWPGDGPRFDCTQAVRAAPDLPKLLVRVGQDYPVFSATQDAFIRAAHAAGNTLDVIDLPEAHHGYETRGHDANAWAATGQAMSWVAETADRRKPASSAAR